MSCKYLGNCRLIPVLDVESRWHIKPATITGGCYQSAVDQHRRADKPDPDRLFVLVRPIPGHVAPRTTITGHQLHPVSNLTVEADKRTEALDGEPLVSTFIEIALHRRIDPFWSKVRRPETIGVGIPYGKSTAQHVNAGQFPGNNGQSLASRLAQSPDLSECCAPLIKSVIASGHSQIASTLKREL
jgi:hypothetical protein